MVADVGQQLRPGLDEVQIVAVAFLRLAAVRMVVSALGGVAVVDQAAVVALEEIELARDRVGEAASAEDQSSSSYRPR